jgi:hypothetical protein
MHSKEKGRPESDPIPNAYVRQDKPESKLHLVKLQAFGRWKSDSEGALRPAGVGIECGAEHIDGFAAMLAATKRRLAQGGK